MSESPTIRIEGKTYDIDSLTLDEVEAIEDTFDAPMEELDWRRAKVLKQIVFAFLSRENTTLTLDDVGKIKLLDALEWSQNGDSPATD